MENSKSGAVQKIIGTCPSCQAPVRLPAGAGIDAMVRCPHCGTTFSLRSIIAEIPELEVIEKTPQRIEPLVDRQSTPRSNSVERKKFQVPNQLIAGAKKRKKNRHNPDKNASPDTQPSMSSVVAETTDSFQISTSSPSQDGHDVVEVSTEESRVGKPSSIREVNSAHAARVRVHSSQRHRRKIEVRRDPSFELAKIVLGGLLAFPVAYLILLWGVGQDPLKLAPSLSRTVPFIVPKKMREAAEKKRDEIRSKRDDDAALDRGGKTRRSSVSDSEVDENINSPNLPASDLSRASDIIPDLQPKGTESIPDVAPDKGGADKQ